MRRPAPRQPPSFLTVAEVAELTRQCQKTIRRAIASGDLHAQRFGRSIRIAEDAYAAYAASRRAWRM